MTLENKFFGLVPVSTLQGTFQAIVVTEVQVGEDTILIRQAAKCRLAGDGVGIGIGCAGAGIGACHGGRNSTHVASNGGGGGGCCCWW